MQRQTSQRSRDPSQIKIPGMNETMINEMFIGKRGRMRTYMFELATGIAFPLVAIAYFLNPNQSSAHSVIGQTVFPFDYIWCCGYILGGVLMLVGIIAPQPRLRASGLIILGAALTMQVVAAVSIRPDLREMFNAIYAAACLTRASLVIRLFYRYRPPDAPS